MCAAHCKQSSNNWTAGAGSATRTRQRQTKSGRSQTAHPSYNQRTIDYDYMVLTVSSSFSYDNYVKPIGLVSTSNASENTGTCTTSGYGYSQVWTFIEWTIILNVYLSILEEIQELLLPPSNGLISNVFPIRNVNVSGALQLSLLVNNVVIPMVLLLAWVILVVRLPSNKGEKMFFSEMFHGDTANVQHRAIQECTLETLSPQFILGSRQTPVSRFTLLIDQITYFCRFINTNCIYSNKLCYLWYNLRRNSCNQSLQNKFYPCPLHLFKFTCCY